MDMNTKRTQKVRNKKRKGFSLVELLIAVVVLGILGTMLFSAGTSAQNKARLSVAQNDLDGIKNAVYQALMLHPEVMKYKDGEPANANQKIVDFINAEVDEAWRFEMLDNPSNSGGVAATEVHRDPWDSPYGLYIYTDTNTGTYTDKTGKLLAESDSVVYIVICSAGMNGTGGPMGTDGGNYSSELNQLTTAANMVNNTDGIDDLGVIIRIRNGSTTTATFGFDTATLGSLEDTQWIFGKPTAAAGGKVFDFLNVTDRTANVKCGGSIDRFYDVSTLGDPPIAVIGDWGTGGNGGEVAGAEGE